MKKRIARHVEVIALSESKKRYVIVLIGLGTVFFGFGAGALLNLYLLSIHSPLVESLRSSLTYKSAIFGDGIVLPIVNMTIAYYLLHHHLVLKQKFLSGAFICGILITVYFHVNQAVNHLVNWAMPTPWHWNILGLWHAIYMFSVSAFISLFYIIVMRNSRYGQRLPKEFFIVTTGLVIFFILLHLDYISVNIRDLFPQGL